MPSRPLQPWRRERSDRADEAAVQLPDKDREPGVLATGVKRSRRLCAAHGHPGRFRGIAAEQEWRRKKEQWLRGGGPKRSGEEGRRRKATSP